MTEETEIQDAQLIEPHLAMIPSTLGKVDRFLIEIRPYVDSAAATKDAALAYIVDSDVSKNFADEIQDSLKRETKDWDEKRKPLTQVLDDLKSLVMTPLKEGTAPRAEAVKIYQQKISAYDRQTEATARQAAQEAERLAKAEQDRLNAEAAALEKRAEELKRPAAIEAAQSKAAELRQTATFIPTSFVPAVSAAPLSASNKARPWKGAIPLCDACEKLQEQRFDAARECRHNKKVAFKTLVNDEALLEAWLDELSISQSGMNKMAVKYTDTRDLPGLRFSQEDSFRSKVRR